MTTGETVQRICIYIGEHDRWEGQALYLAILERLRQAGATGATALRGLAGFGPGQRTRAAGRSAVSAHPPVVIEWIDRAERIARTLPLLDDMLANALITVEEVRLYRAVLRGRGPLPGDRSVGDVMRAAPQTIAPTAPIGAALDLLLAHDQTTLPVIDERRQALGLITDETLARRAGLRLPLRLLRLLDPAERQRLVAPYVERPVAEVMNPEVRVVYASAEIAQALVTMIEWSYTQIPVVDRDGALVGLLDERDVMGAVLAQAPRPAGGVRDAEPPTPVSLVMQTMVPQIAANQPLAAALEHLLATPGRYLVVVDAGGHVLGSLSDSSALRGLTGPERDAWLATLQQSAPAAPPPAITERSLELLLERNIPVAAPTDTIIDITRRMLELNAERMPVVDADRKLLGLIARGGLLRALIQESA